MSPRRPPRPPSLLRTGALIVALSSVLAGCAHVVAPGIPFEPDGGRYDFSRPPSPPAPAPGETTPEDRVVLRYLGAGGLFVGWRGRAVLLGPFFSNPGTLRVGLGRIRWREEVIDRALEPLPVERVGAILAGHSHYDHIGDLPVIARDHAGGASLLVNRSGVAALGPYPELVERARALEEIEGRWQRLEDASGTPLPFRVLALPSDHAPHVAGMLVMDGETTSLRRDWERTRYWKLKTGRTYAFVLDLLGDPAGVGEPPVRFRIVYQDAASPGVAAALPDGGAGKPPVDLAVLCMPSAHLVPPYPRRVLERTEPRHALVIHYESFFRPWGRSAPFAPFLTRERAERFLRTVDEVLGSSGPGAPVEPVSGPHGERWTMPLVGEWLVFEPG